MTAKRKPSPKASSDASGKQRRYTDAEKAAAIAKFKADGLTAAAKLAGASKGTVTRWLRAAGVDPVEHDTDEKRRQTAAARAARLAAVAERRAVLSDLLIAELGPKAAGLLLKRLDAELALDEVIAADEERLEDAITSLRVLTETSAALDSDESLDADTRKARKAAQKSMMADARQAVKDCVLVLGAHHRRRTTVPELVGVLTRSVTDHLNLEKGDAGVEAGGGITVVLTANRPTRTPPAVVTLDPEPELAR